MLNPAIGARRLAWVTSNIADLGDSDPLMWFLLEFHSLSGFFTYDDNRKGWLGYKYSRDIEYGCGKFAWGGEHQKNTLHCELTAKGCAAITDWPKLREWLERMEAKITRVDIAHDDHEGKTINLDLCKQWLEEGLFSLGKREPDRRLIDDLGTGKDALCTSVAARMAGCFAATKRASSLNGPQNATALAVLEKQKGQHEANVFVYGGRPIANVSTKAWWAALERCGNRGFQVA